jgi:hypothetical protein
MQDGNVRVVLASGDPQTRTFLKDLIEGQNEGIIVGQADNEINALTMTQRYRPDVAIIDSTLPYSVGLDYLPLSRISGLDTAQFISEQMPNIQVILVNNIDNNKTHPGTGSLNVLSRDSMASTYPLILRKLPYKSNKPKSVIFADVDVNSSVQEETKIDDGFSFALILLVFVS